MNKKNMIRLTESQLKKIITESVKRVLKESEVKNDRWYGCRNIRMIWHGTNSDPELEARGYRANYWDIEDSWWRTFLDETGHSDNESNDPAVEREFARYLRSNEYSIIEDIMNSGYRI